MTDTTNGLHHIEFHTVDPEALLDLFVRTYAFELVAERRTCACRQWLLKSSDCQLLISSVTIGSVEEKNTDHYDILTTLLADSTTRELICDRDTVFNVALEVKCIQAILQINPNVQVLVSPRRASDAHGSIEYACIKSCIGNVVHTLIDTSQYAGPHLPGFVPTAILDRSVSRQAMIAGIDHVAFALPKHGAFSAVTWYETVLGMKRLVVNQEDDPFQGFAVRVGTMGMRLFAGEHWKCAATACVSAGSSSLKIVFAESLIDTDSNSKDQITNFIARHQNQAGIQHIGFTCSIDIKDAVRTASANGAQFLSPCTSYYLKENNGRLIGAAGEEASELGQLGILLDDESDGSESRKKVLLQIFTKSIFNADTFFLELIERRGAIGFGAGNIRTLWKIVQERMSGEA